jgi:branched-chain amino acid transport system permease protein
VSVTNFSVSRTTRGGWVVFAIPLLAVAVLASVPGWGDLGMLHTLIEVLYLVALAQTWNLLAGYAGLISIGQQAYIGIGAYALIFMANTLGINVFVALVLAGFLAAAISIPTAALVFRLRGGYFAIGTWVIAEAFRLLVVNTHALGGGSGATLTAVSTLSRGDRVTLTYWTALAIAALSVLLVYIILRSNLGLALTSIRDNETAAAGLGVRVFRTKFLIYVLAAFVTGLTGALIYLDLLRVQPEAAFSVNWAAFMVFIVLTGGIGTIEGPIIGTLIFFGVEQVLAVYGSWYLIVLGVVAIVMMVRAPQGVWGLISQRWGIQFFPVQRHLISR